MPNDNMNLALFIIIALAGREVIILAVRKWWKKSVDTNYVTEDAFKAWAEEFSASCTANREHCNKGRTLKDLDSIKLLNAVRNEIRMLRVALVKKMVRDGATENEIGQLLDSDHRGFNHE